MMKQYKTKNGFYKGQMSPAIASLNGVIELAGNEKVYVTADNEMIVSDKAPKGSLLLSERPETNYRNVGGKWIKLEARPELTTLSVDSAFMKLIGAYSVAGNYPEKQKAMSVAVETLGEHASEDDLYNEAVKQLV